MLNLKNTFLNEWFLILLLVGYTIVSSFAIPLSIENSRIFSIPYRIIIFALSLYIIYKNFSFYNFKNIAVISLFLFWIFYFLKTYYSFSHDFYSVKFSESFSEIYVRIGVIAFVPSLALLLINYRKINFETVASASLKVISFMLSINLIFALAMPYGNFMKYIFSMYYISYGHLGTSLFLISLFFILFKPKLINPYILYYSLFLGLLTVIIGAARSPFLALMLVSVYLLLLKKNFKLILGFVLFAVLSVIFIYMLGKSQVSSITFVNRTYLMLFEGDTSLRGPLFSRAIEIFKDNLFFGDRTHYEDGSYPHNIFLELLLATGILGLVLYFIKFIPVINQYKLFTSVNTNVYYILFFTFFLQYFVLVCTSFTLYSVPEFLYFSSIIIGISLNHSNEKIKSSDGSRNKAGNN